MRSLLTLLGHAVMVALLGLLPGLAAAQAAAEYPPPVVFSQEELDQLMAPIALYPDTLLTQVLVASTYPLEVVAADRFLKANPDLKGDALTTAAQNKTWDLSVISLLQFPSVIAMMNDKLEWTQQLGDAFLGQQGDVMDTVQNLRARAQQAGNLKSTDQQRVVVQEEIIVIESAQPQTVYVPYYNPTIVYGSWWWPARPPMYWMPPPMYRPPGFGDIIVGGIFFGIGVGISNAIWNDYRPSWHSHQINVVNNVTIVNVNHNRPRPPNGQWQHDPVHRKGVAYRDNQVRDRVTAGTSVRPGAMPGAVDQRPGRGDDANLNLRPSTGGPGRPNPPPSSRPGTKPEGRLAPPVTRPTPGPAERPSSRPVPKTAPESRPAARPTPQPSPISPGGSRDAQQAQADRGRASREAAARSAARPAPAVQPVARPAPMARPAPAAQPAPAARPAPGARPAPAAAR